MNIVAQFPFRYQNKEHIAQVLYNRDLYVIDLIGPGFNFRTGLMLLEINSRRVKISNLINFTEQEKETINGIGRLFIECVVIRSIEEDISRVVLNSFAPALFFYWKMGFRPTSLKIQRKMKADYDLNAGDSKKLKALATSSYDGGDMYLPRDKLEMWKALILKDDNPLLSEKAFVAILRGHLKWSLPAINTIIFSYFIDIGKAPKLLLGGLLAS